MVVADGGGGWCDVCVSECAVAEAGVVAAAGGDVLCDKNDIVVLNIVGLDTDQEASNKDDHDDAGLEPLFVSQLCDKRKHVVMKDAKTTACEQRREGGGWTREAMGAHGR